MAALKLLRIEEVAEMTGIKVRTLRAYRAANTGPRSSRLSGRVVYREADVIAWVEQQLEQSSVGGVA